jgi:hypothetical protein
MKSFNRNALIVDLPTGVLPTIFQPFDHEKCVLQFAPRGLNNGSNRPVCGSGKTTFDPLRMEQVTQARAKFERIVLPPLEFG